ncbi:kinase-like domain-containing protein [Xylaria sp. FL1042]|nr:kinase-like domain-containing protein [Xylaria sp. FL1042]
MAVTANGLDRALAAIRNANLRYPDEELLVCFLQDSIDPAAAACYMLQRCSVGRDGVDLTPLLSDWKKLIASFTYEVPPYRKPNRAVVAGIQNRDGGKCCITGLKSSLFDPLVVVPILPMLKPIQKSLHELLGVFIGPEIQQRILFHDASLHDPSNHWLVRKSATAAWTQGWFQFTFSSGTKYCVTTLIIGGPALPSIVDKTPPVRFGCFADHSASNMDTPNVFLLQVLSRFAKPMRWTLVAREIAAKQPQPQPRRAIKMPSSLLSHLLLEYAAVSITTVWCLVPTTFRIQVYRCLEFLGVHLYGSSCSLKVQRLPFGMYLKTARAENHEALANEYGALQLVRRHTHIPAPRPLDLVSNARTSYLLTSRVPGLLLGACIDTLSDDEVNTLVCDLQSCLGQLRAIAKEVAPQYAITNALGKPCYDYRIIAGVVYDEERGDFAGPFVDEEEFNKTLQMGALPGVSHRSGHKIVFTHADLNMRNVLMQNGRLSGIVDWENSGWFPEYWDYTKAHFTTKLKKRWLGIVDEVFKQFGDFESELAIERQFWEYC